MDAFLKERRRKELELERIAIEKEWVQYNYLLCLYVDYNRILIVFLVVLQPDSFRGMEVQRKSTEAQQSGHSPRSGLEIKDGRKYPSV